MIPGHWFHLLCVVAFSLNNTVFGSTVFGSTVFTATLFTTTVFTTTVFTTTVFTTTVQAAESSVADAAERGDWAAVRRQILEQQNINAAQSDGMTALHWAAWHDDHEMVTLLIRHGADIQVVNHYSVSALTIACRNGNATIVRELLQAGAMVNQTAPGGVTPLMEAARTGRPEVVEALIQYKADVNATERSGQTALMWAAADGHTRAVELLLSAGADHEITLDSGFNALFFAVREGRSAVVSQLLNQGADVNAAMLPRIRGARSVRAGTSPLVLAVENGHFELAAELLARGADPNDQRSGFAPLHVISWVRSPNSGDDVDGDPPPTGSGNLTSLELVSRLVQHGADVNLQLDEGRSGRGRLNQTGATPFLMAADTADVPLMKLLLELGADFRIPNADHCPPLLAAAGIGTMAPGEEAGTEDEAVAAVQLLLELGADINAKDANGETAMHGAAYKNLPAMVRFLASHGADPEIWNRKNKYGWTPLLIAEGYRPGNFKPSAATVSALHAVMREAGIEPPAASEPRPARNNDQYAPPKTTAGKTAQ